MIQLHEIECKTALNNLRRKMPYSWDLNIYRGCEHGCKYCFAMYSHDYLNDSNYFGNVYVKSNIVELLEKELRSRTWKQEIVNIGGVTDSYQACEEKYKLMPDILKLLIKYKTPAIISTKSDLILRDYNLIDELSKITYVNVAATIITTDEDLRRKIEPGSVESSRRFDMLRAFRKTNASVGLHMMPVIPFLTDNFENLNSICAQGGEINVHYLLPGTLYLKGKTRPYFLNFIREQFPELYPRFLELYKTGGSSKAYKDKLYSTLNSLRNKYGISSSYSKPMKEKMHTKAHETIQKTLF